jgi:hypothetical protein
MATVKKTAKPKKPAAKKPAAKKPAVKKPAVKTAVKKPAVKKTAAAKPAVKKPTAAKSAVKKPATAKKEAPKAAGAKKPAIKTGAKEQKTIVSTEIKSRNLFDAFKQGKFPIEQGYIVSSFFKESSAYSVFEIVSYAGVKEIFPIAGGLQFVTNGKKLYVLVEPDTYHNKPLEPVSRSKTDNEYIPKRFSELETITAKNQTKIMVAKEPIETFGSFTILEPSGINFSIVFYESPNIFDSLTAFFQNTLNRRKVPEGDAKRAAKFITDTIVKTMSSKSEFV